jgi:hypothetical protein
MDILNNTTTAPNFQVTNPPEEFSNLRRIDSPYELILVLHAWRLIPGRYDVEKSKRANDREICRISIDFRNRARLAGIVVSRKIPVLKLLFIAQHYGIASLPGYEQAEDVLLASLFTPRVRG